MQTLSDSVGPGQPNNRSDVALVQAALKRTSNANGSPYLAGQIDGGYGPMTEAAIGAFQNDHGGDRVPIASLVITPDGATQTAMRQQLPAASRDLRVLSGQRVVYLGRPQADATTSSQFIRTHVALRVAFRGRVAQLVDDFHRDSGIVLSLTPTGARRTFAQQAAIQPPQSYAGPGESNHNYGNAVDIGFNGLQWFQRDGTLVADDHWLNRLAGYDGPSATAFWDARDVLALVAPISLYRLRIERIHLQDFDDANTSSGRSLAAHLTNVGAWNWQTGRYDRTSRDWYYECSLGGAVFVEVGTANQIWAGNASVTAAEIQAAGWVRPPAAGGAPGAPGAATPPITPADIAAVRAALQADFVAADTHWQRWTPVP